MNVLVKPLVVLKKRNLSFKQLQQPKIVLGTQGEARAVQFLTQKKYKILHTNLVLNTVEVDIIALDIPANELVFCEVKTRSTSYFGDPSQAINFAKLKKLRQAATIYLTLYPSTNPYRIDSIAVLPTTIYHYENITM